MGYLSDIINYFSKLFQWWITVAPWERGLRIRFGKRVKVLEPGIHFRIPLFDSFYIQPIRQRVLDMPIQTLSSKDGHTITVKSALAYSICDIQKLYNTISQPDMTISNMVLGKIADHISNNNVTDCKPKDVQDKVKEALASLDCGIKFEYVSIVGYAIVRTYRIIQDGSWLSEGTIMDKIK